MKTLEEIKTSDFKKIARDYALTTFEQFMKTHSSILSSNDMRFIKKLFFELTKMTCSHFSSDGYQNIDSEEMNIGSLCQHIGYVSNCLIEKYPDISLETCFKILFDHFHSGEDITALSKKFPDDNISKFIQDDSNSWMFWKYGFGNVDKALNRPGFYSGKATLKLARYLLNGKTSKNIISFFSQDTKELFEILKGEVDIISVIVTFSARASQLTWYISKLGQGYVESFQNNPKALSRWNGPLMIDFDMLYEKNPTEIMKDFVQVQTYIMFTKKYFLQTLRKRLRSV